MSSIPARRQSARQHVARASRLTCEALEGRRLLSGGLALGNEQVDLPRSLTPAEREYLKTNPLGGPGLAAPSAPPTGPIDPVAEYEPMEGLVISWTGISSEANILTQMTKRVTDAGGRMYVNVGSPTSQTSAANTLINAGVNMDNVTFRQYGFNTVWIRDYGPRYVYESDVRVITDHLYNRPRPADDQQPNDFAALKQHQYYEIGLNNTTLIHGGGNYHLDANGDAYSTQLIGNENPSFTQAQIQQIWNTYQNNNTTITGAFPTTVDATQHIDMWMQIYGDDKVFISDFANPSGAVATADAICDSTASLMASRGYQVTRIPGYSISGTHFTFANMVIFNDVVLLPQYNAGPGAAVSNQVLAQVQAAFGPGTQVFQINADGIVGRAGVFHCIEQHIPAHKGLAGSNGGLAPTVYVRNTTDGQTYNAGQQVEIQWITDDDAPVAASGGVSGVDVLLSTDGGQSFNTTVAANRPALGSFVWTVPGGINTSQARLRVVARDGVGNTGFDVTDANFTIVDPVVPAVAGSDFLFETAPHRFTFAFSANVGASLGSDDLVLENLTSAQTIPTSDLTLSYNAGTNTGTFTYTGTGGVLPDGRYRATLLAAGITNPTGTPMSSNHVFHTHVLAGDANRDGRVNLDDFNILAGNFGQSPRTFSQGDFNYSGNVNLDDFNLLASRFGTVLAAASSASSSPFGQTRSGDAGDADDDDVADLLA
jgi:agmatine/peptidylarginine deiminase